MCGSLVAEEGEQPRFAQIYVCDPATQHSIRMDNMFVPKALTEKQKMCLSLACFFSAVVVYYFMVSITTHTYTQCNWPLLSVHFSRLICYALPSHILTYVSPRLHKGDLRHIKNIVFYKQLPT